jgi:cytochrome c biogenesis protein CcmG, thiol:disulfide interchange protein DsbE
LVAASFAAEPEIGEPAPALHATELDGQTFDLAQMRGKVVIVNFWATWCGPCRVEMPALDTFYRAFRDRGLVLIGVSVDRWSDRGKVGRVMRDLSYPAAMINEASADDFPRPTEIPITYVVDRAGVLRAIMRGEDGTATTKTLAETVLPLLRHRAAPVAPNMSTQAAPSCDAGTQLPCRPGRKRSGSFTVAIGPSARR